jgi:hypothetical protein
LQEQQGRKHQQEDADVFKLTIGTPARPQMTNGQTRRKSIVFQIDGSVETCAITEQTSTSGTASVGGST